MDAPEAFGQHPNADVASQITEARTLFETLLSLQPQTTPTGVAGQSREDKVPESLPLLVSCALQALRLLSGPWCSSIPWTWDSAQSS